MGNRRNSNRDIVDADWRHFPCHGAKPKLGKT